MMITIRIVCDRAAAQSFSVQMGAEWIRITVYTPPVTDWAAALQEIFGTVVRMLLVIVVPNPTVSTKFIFEGADAHEARVDVAGIAMLAWSTALQRLNAQVAASSGAFAGFPTASSPNGTPPSTKPTLLSAVVPNTKPTPLSAVATPSAAAFLPPTKPVGVPAATVSLPAILEPLIATPGSTVSVSSAASTPPAAASTGGPEMAVFRQMVSTVRTHLEKYGASPNFKSDRVQDREKVYNYIRTVLATPKSPPTLCEAVRQAVVASP
jgi:hypothetical protein